MTIICIGAALSLIVLALVVRAASRDNETW